MKDKAEGENFSVNPYLTLRKIGGVLGIALSVVLTVGGLQAHQEKKHT